MNSEFRPVEVFFRCQTDAEKFGSWAEAKIHRERTGHTSFKAIERKEDEAV